MIRWFANNGIAANLLMFAILAAGFNAAWNKVPLEVVPESSAWEIVYMEMPYRGGTPKDIEENVLIPVERALEGISGIREVNSDGMPGMAKFYFKAKEGVDLDKLLDEIKGRIDTSVFVVDLCGLHAVKNDCRAFAERGVASAACYLCRAWAVMPQ